MLAAGADVQRGGGVAGPPLGPEEERILHLASLAASSHNTQPWTVRVESAGRLTVTSDATRKLEAVDPEGRELVLSLGTFLENLSQAAHDAAREATLEVVAEPRSPSASVKVRLEPRAPGDGHATLRIEHRRTLRKDYRNVALTPTDRDALLAAAGAAIYVEAGSKEAAWLADAAVASFRQQSWRDDAQAELAEWIRFSSGEIERRRDGLTIATMQIGGLAGFWARHFMGKGSVAGKQFREAGIDGVATQAREGAGFIVITSPDESATSLIDAGRRFERMVLLVGERKLAAHPMSSLLEEEPWRAQVASATGSGGIPQFVVRVGHVDEQPAPVSPRRRVSDFTRVGGA